MDAHHILNRHATGNLSMAKPSSIKTCTYRMSSAIERRAHVRFRMVVRNVETETKLIGDIKVPKIGIIQIGRFMNVMENAMLAPPGNEL